MSTNPSPFPNALNAAALLAQPPAIPADNTFLAWAYDPVEISTGTVMPTLGSLILTRIQVRSQIVTTNVTVYVVAGGTTLTAGQNFIGLYSAQTAGAFTAGGLIAGTADQSTNWAGGFTSPVAWSAGRLRFRLGVTGLRCW